MIQSYNELLNHYEFKGVEGMGKKKAVLDTKGLNRLDNRLYYLIAISIFLITFIVRLKKLTFYYSYDLQNRLGAVFNTFTYYKLLGLITIFLIGLGIFTYRSMKYHIKFKLDAITIGILLIIISSMISTLFTDLTKEAIWGFYTRTNGLMAYVSLFGLLLIISKLNIGEKQLRFLAHGVNIVSIIIVGICIMEFFGHSIFMMDWYRSIYVPAELRSIVKINTMTPKYVAGSILVQQNYFGAYCSIIFSFITIYAIHSKKWLDKILFSIGSIALFVGTYISSSMGPWLTLLITLILIVITFKHWKSYIHISVLILLYTLTTALFARYQPLLVTETQGIINIAVKILNYKMIILALPVILLFVLYYRFSNKTKYRLISIIIIISILVSILGFVYVLQNIVANNMDMLSNRGYAWHYTYQMLKQNFIIGYGPDTFFYNFPQNNPDAAIYSPGIVFDKPHNMYLQVFMDNGLFGIVGFIMLLSANLLVLLKSTYNSEETSTITYSIAAFFTAIAYMIQGITNDNHMVIQPILYLIIATGIAISKKGAAIKL